MKIITLTLSPALDIHCSAEFFREGCENFADIKYTDVGGKGINISRALSASGIDSLAISLIGNNNGEDFIKRLSNDKINLFPIFVNGRIRENITIHETSGRETRLSFSGFKGNDNTIDEIEKIISKDPCDIFVLAGSIPQGISKKRITELLLKIKSIGAKLIIDSRSFTALELCQAKPYLIKPNSDELAIYMGKKNPNEEEMLSFAGDLITKGIKNMIISLGEKGAYFISEKEAYHASAPAIEPISTIGAGDSLIAGYISGLVDGADTASCLCRAVAFGTSACLTDGTKPPKIEDIQKFVCKITVKKITI